MALGERNIHYGDWNSTRYLNWAKSKGPHTYRVIFKLFEGEKIEQKYYRAAHSILKLADKWSDERLENACQYALTVFSRPTYQNIKNIITSSEDLKALDEYKNHQNSLIVLSDKTKHKEIFLMTTSTLIKSS